MNTRIWLFLFLILFFSTSSFCQKHLLRGIIISTYSKEDVETVCNTPFFIRTDSTFISIKDIKHSEFFFPIQYDNHIYIKRKDLCDASIINNTDTLHNLIFDIPAETIIDDTSANVDLRLTAWQIYKCGLSFSPFYVSLNDDKNLYKYIYVYGICDEIEKDCYIYVQLETVLYYCPFFWISGFREWTPR